MKVKEWEKYLVMQYICMMAMRDWPIETLMQAIQATALTLMSIWFMVKFSICLWNGE